MAYKAKSPAKQVWKWLGIIFILLIICFLAGIIIGYVTIGKGQFSDVFLPYTWYHIFDFLK